MFLDASLHLKKRLPSVRLSLHPSIILFFKCENRVFSSIKTASDCAWRREVIGSDERAGKGVTTEGAIRDEASEETTRGMNLTAVYPALLLITIN